MTEDQSAAPSNGESPRPFAEEVRAETAGAPVETPAEVRAPDGSAEAATPPVPPAAPIDQFATENANAAPTEEKPAAAEPAPNSSPTQSGTSESAAAEQPAAAAPSPEVTQAAPAEQPAEQPAPKTEAPAIVGGGQETPPAEQPAPTLSAPTPQPPLPGPDAFNNNGSPSPSTVPAERKGVYVDSDGVRHDVSIVAQRKDGSFDILMPASVGGYRRDAVSKRQDQAQTGDYLV